MIGVVEDTAEVLSSVLEFSNSGEALRELVTKSRKDAFAGEELSSKVVGGTSKGLSTALEKRGMPSSMK